MAVNLLNTSDYETARVTLDHSFAQWEANESAWQLEAQMETLRKALEGTNRPSNVSLVISRNSCV